MPTYLERLQSEFDELTENIETILQRASDADEELSAEQNASIVERDKRREELQKAIDVQAGLTERSNKVADVIGKVRTAGPTITRTRVDEPAYDIAREFPTPGAYAVTLHKAMFGKDPQAQAAIERAAKAAAADAAAAGVTQHQTTADNPGLIPRPILGPVINLLDARRPFISAITTRPLPTGKFDRPIINQHVAVGKQAAEKDRTVSQKLLIGNLPVEAATYAGHLNISRQDIKWTSPAILDIVYEDFAAIYAIETCADAVDQFMTSLADGTPVPIPSADGKGITGALYAAAAAALGRSNRLPDTLFVAPDVWAALGGMANPMGVQSFPSLSLTGTGGNPLGLRLVVDQHFPPGTMILGPAGLLEWYEDLDGLMQVGEPDVLGQLVGYAGYAAFLNTAPQAFTALTLPGASGGAPAVSASTGDTAADANVSASGTTAKKTAATTTP